LASGLVPRTITDERWRYAIRELIRYTAIGVLPMTTLGIWAQGFQGLLLILGATGAGLAHRAGLGPSQYGQLGAHHLLESV
jgi:hypothetical protein